MTSSFFDSGDKSSCCGCKLCGSVCPVKAISFSYDEEGFWYPVTDSTLCIKCGRCRRECPLAQESLPELDCNRRTYAAFSKSEEVLAHSASGGLFTAFSDVILNEGGSVFGHVWDEHCRAVCIGTESALERDRMRGSKYVQSDMGTVYAQIETAARSGKKVLVTGTPCQIDAMHRFLGKSCSDNLYTLDIVCHGVPSPRIFAEYLEIMGRRAGKKIKDVVFRGKRNGWNMPLMEFCYADGSHAAELLNADAFNNLFQGTDCILRPSCYKCRYAGALRISDISIGDFWGVEERHADMFNDNRGVSLMTVNTKKGEWLFAEAEDSVVSKQIPLCDATKRNYPLCHPTAPYFERARFFRDYHKKGLEWCLRSYMPKSLFTRGLRKIRRIFARLLG